MVVAEKIKLLTIDDEDGLRRSILMFFEDEGFTVFEADNGLDGLAIFRECQPDVVLCDLRMPKMDGLEVIKVLAAEAPDTPVIVVSGTGVLEDAIEAIRAGAWDYVTKPVTDLLVLEHTVQKALEKAALVEENRMYQEHLEELVEERTAELRQAQKIEAIGTLAGGIAHDFNNILTGIIGFNELSLMLCKDEKIIEFQEEIQKASARAKMMVQQILAFSRKDEQKCYPLQFDLIIREVFNLIRSSIPSSIVMTKQLATTAHVLADSSQLHQVVMNLCTNASQAMENGEGQLSVYLDQIVVKSNEVKWGADVKPGAYVQLQIKDTGCGMEQEVRERVFDPYFTTKETGRGTGLGLSVVHGIVTSCGGTISVQSEQGHGATFSVLLPVVSGDVATDKEEEVEAEPLLDGTESILFVDDEQIIVDLAQSVFANYGYDICCYTSSVEALAAFHKDPQYFDVIVTDMTMPKMNGDTFAKEVLTVNNAMSIVLCTGFSEAVSPELLKELGINYFVQKPVPMSEVVQVVRSVLDAD